MILNYFDASYIMIGPMKSQHEAEMIWAYNVLINKLKTQGSHPMKQIMDNKISIDYQKTGNRSGTVTQRGSLRNAAKKVIQTAKKSHKSHNCWL